MNAWDNRIAALCLAAAGAGVFTLPSIAQSRESSTSLHQLRNQPIEGGQEYLLRSLVAGPIQAHCYFSDSDNVSSDPALPRDLAVPAGGEVVLAKMHPTDPRRAFRATVVCAAQVGDAAAHPGFDFNYALPFRAGTSYTLEQGFNGRYSHNDAENRYALDLGVPEGTPVLAARAGVVMQAEDDFTGGGTDARYADRANYVRVLHEDGSMAVYAHLASGSRPHLPGDRVSVGEMIGRSGNTGHSTGPHLHFSVQRNAGMDLVSIPFRMAGIATRAAGN